MMGRAEAGKEETSDLALIDPTAMTGVAATGDEDTAVVAVAAKARTAEVAATATLPPMIKVPRKAIREATITTSRLPRKTSSIRTATMLHLALGSTMLQIPPLGSTRVMVMKESFQELKSHLLTFVGRLLSDDAGQNYEQGGNNGRFQKRPQRREREEKVHDSIIEERIQRERPCRTLFIRNIKASWCFYETNSDDVRRLFEEHGDIKTFFDLIANRGMVFVTYYDLRAAERARERLQGSEISGRPIDVHYSLPRDDNGKGADRQREQELQGTLLVTLRNSPSNQPIDDEELRRKFQQFGDVKSVRPVGDRPDQRLVEFYDTRASEEAHERLRHQGLQDGVMDIVFAYTGTDEPQTSFQHRDHQQYDRAGNFERQRDWDEPPSRGRRGGRGGRGRGRGYNGGNEWGDRRDSNNDRDRTRSYDDEVGRSQRGNEYGSRYGNKHGPGGYGSPGPSGPSYSAPPATGYGQAPAAPAEVGGFGANGTLVVHRGHFQAADERERLEQAKRVQQLLAALKQPQVPATTTSAAPQAAPPTMQHIPPAPAAPANPYYSQSSMPMPPQAPAYGTHPPAPAANPYAAVPSQASSTPQAGQAAPSAPIPGLPPNILALLQQSTQHQQPPQTGLPPAMPPYSMPPASAMIGAQQGQQQQQQSSMPGLPPPNPSQPGYQQLMAYLQSQKR
ncbi:hypothetical protein BN946_scf185007.g192 [Trametes cinnabarina]|uniref:RRM domain-containing protein n=1 Tax=Pycnoporus cinnabarinus TaxID=5643 RepID=A0A060SF33_PYCCI|nr:hypothetical protein BN946_scf185007.g192 [Trametes cinnabarina]